MSEAVRATDHSLVARRPVEPLPCGCAATIECATRARSAELFCESLDARTSKDLFGGEVMRPAGPGEVFMISGLTMVKGRGPSLACDSLALDDEREVYHVLSICSGCRKHLARGRKALLNELARGLR